MVALACSAVSASTPTPAPTATVVSTPTVVPLYQQVTLTSLSSTETGQPFGYTITLQTPVLTGSNDPRLRLFNAEMDSFVSSAASGFKVDLANVPPTPDSNSSTFDVRYDVLLPPGPIISLQLQTEGYITGAAHPFHTSHSVNFDIQAGRDLTLADLFVPGSEYLQSISQHCIQELLARKIDFSDFTAGAAPTPDNYRNWNITNSGLLITFDEYQVAPYAAGPQQVTIPYSQLAPLILDPGPVSPFAH